jgi:hypothetical protein
LWSFWALTNPAISKHAVLGLLRSLYAPLYPNLPIRINAVAPSWTDTPIMPREVIAALSGGKYQSADVVAQSVVLLMADWKRHGELVHSDMGVYTELENGDRGFHVLVKGMFGVGVNEEERGGEVLPKVRGVKEMSEREKECGADDAE